MNKFTSHAFLQIVASVVALLSFIAVFALVVAEVYVRWNLNRDFSFLGGGELAALTVSAFALLITLLVLSARTKN